MATTFADALLYPDCYLRFYLYVEGIPELFLDGATPVGPDGVAWTAPTSKSRSYTVREYVLDVSNGIRDNGPDISRRTAEVSPSRMTITLQDDRAGNVLALMARNKTSGNKATLAASFGFADGSPPSTMTVDDNSAWTSTGYLYFGRETIYYGAKPSATTFGTLTRDVFQLDDGGSTYGDARYVHNGNVPTPGGFSLVSDYPRVWHNRWVSLRAYVVDAFGRAYDTAYDGDASREIWRGVVQGNPIPRDDWMRWDLRCSSLESLLDTEVGGQTVNGALLRYPGGAQANNDSQATVDAGGNPIDQETGTAYVYYVDDSTRFVDFVITEYTSAANYNSDTVAGKYELYGDDRITVVASAAVKTTNGLMSAFDTTVAAALTAAGVSNLSIQMYQSSSGNGPVISLQSWSNYVHEVTIKATVPGSICNLIGIANDQTVVTSTTASGLLSAFLADQSNYRSVYVPAHALTIPVFFSESAGYNPSTGGLPDNVPSSGYAKIGESEFVKYGSITDLSDSFVKGLFQLNVTERGAFNTKPEEHVVPSVLGKWSVDVPLTVVEFGTGFSSTDPLTALLQLSVSTGNGHHTAYDTLGFGVGPQINPTHFDRDQIASEAAQLPEGFQELTFFLSKSTKLTDLITSWLAPLGLYLYGGVTDGDEYRIRVGKVLPALESESEDTFDTTNILRDDPAEWVDGITRISNQLVVHYQWDVVDEKETKDTITVNAWDSQREFGVKGKLTWKLRGYNFDAVTALPTVASWAQQTFARFGRPYDLFKVRTARLGWDIQPGDVVALTLPGVPTTTGTRGYTSQNAVVLTVARDWHAGAGGGRTGADLTVLLEDDIGRYSTYSPSARVTSKAGNDVVVAANDFTQSGHSTDAAHFEAGDKIVIFNAGDLSSREAHVIDSITGNTITLVGTLSLTVGSATYLIPDDYATVQSTQHVHVFIADNSDPAVLTAGGDTTAFWYV